MAISGAAVQIQFLKYVRIFYTLYFGCWSTALQKKTVSQESLATYQPLKPPLLCASPLFAQFWSRAVRIEYQAHLVLLPFINNGKQGNKRR